MHAFLYYYGGRLSHAEVLGGWEKIHKRSNKLRISAARWLLFARAQQKWCAGSAQGGAPAVRGLLAWRHHRNQSETGRTVSPGPLPLLKPRGAAAPSTRAMFDHARDAAPLGRPRIVGHSAFSCWALKPQQRPAQALCYP